MVTKKIRDRFVVTPFYTPRFIKPQGLLGLSLFSNYSSSFKDDKKITPKKYQIVGTILKSYIKIVETGKHR